MAVVFLQFGNPLLALPAQEKPSKNACGILVNCEGILEAEDYHCWHGS
jgi:hypothetical protein